jgi:hypothetical protein
MCFESIIGCSMLCAAAVGYTAFKLVERVNWPLFWFTMRGGFAR